MTSVEAVCDQSRRDVLGSPLVAVMNHPGGEFGLIVRFSNCN